MHRTNHGDIVLERIQEVGAVVHGASSVVHFEFAQETLPELEDTFRNPEWRWAEQGELSLGALGAWLGRYPRTVPIPEQQIFCVELACEATLASGGLRGVYYAARGWKRAAKNVLEELSQSAQASTDQID